MYHHVVVSPYFSYDGAHVEIRCAKHQPRDKMRDMRDYLVAFIVIGGLMFLGGRVEGNEVAIAPAMMTLAVVGVLYFGTLGVIAPLFTWIGKKLFSAKNEEQNFDNTTVPPT